MTFSHAAPAKAGCQNPGERHERQHSRDLLRAVLMVSFAGAGLWATSVLPVSAEEVRQTNLVSDGFVPAKLVDKQLLNPWGISEGPTTPFWVSDNNAGVATIYSVPPSNSSVSRLGLFVNVPPATGAAMSNPTGQVFNSVGGFDLSNGKPATFLFELRGRRHFRMELGARLWARSARVDRRGQRESGPFEKRCL